MTTIIDINTCDTNVRFVRHLASGSDYWLGTAVKYADGWRFISNTQHKSSRKFHPSLKACLPRWVGYPDHCEAIPVEAKS